MTLFDFFQAEELPVRRSLDRPVTSPDHFGVEAEPPRWAASRTPTSLLTGNRREPSVSSRSLPTRCSPHRTGGPGRRDITQAEAGDRTATNVRGRPVSRRSPNCAPRTARRPVRAHHHPSGRRHRRARVRHHPARTTALVTGKPHLPCTGRLRPPGVDRVLQWDRHDVCAAPSRCWPPTSVTPIAAMPWRRPRRRAWQVVADLTDDLPVR